MQVKASLALVGEGLDVAEGVCIHIDDRGVVESIEGWGSCREGALGGSWAVAVPQPANMHVHSADGAFPEFGEGLGLHELVAPPEGLKYRLLSSLGFQQTVTSISRTYLRAAAEGVGLLVDFREGGGVGCLAAQEARRLVQGAMDVVVLGTPGPAWPMWCSGLGLSSPLDYPASLVTSLARSHRPSMTHVAEDPANREQGDLEVALEAGFDAIVHGTHLSERDLAEVAAAGVGLVSCPRSNLWHGLRPPPVAAAVRLGVRLALGSDNAAWADPSPWAEASLALELARSQGLRGEIASRAVAEALFVNGYRMLGARPRTIEEGREARLVLIDGDAGGIVGAASPLAAIVKRSGAHLVARVDGTSVAPLGRGLP